MLTLSNSCLAISLAFLLAACGSQAEHADAHDAGADHDTAAVDHDASGNDHDMTAAADHDAAGNDHDAAGSESAEVAAAGFYSLSSETLGGEPVNLADYDGHVSLVVNVASKCGYTGQYAGLQKLHEEFADQGLVVMGFPSNDFGAQEPGSADEIQAFCSGTYGVEFPMFAKVVTRDGADQSPVYSMLSDATGDLPGWNFCKYLVGRDGEVLGFYKSNVAPESDELRSAIQAALAG